MFLGKCDTMQTVTFHSNASSLQPVLIHHYDKLNYTEYLFNRRNNFLFAIGALISRQAITKSKRMVRACICSKSRSTWNHIGNSQNMDPIVRSPFIVSSIKHSKSNFGRNHRLADRNFFLLLVAQISTYKIFVVHLSSSSSFPF
jgi:hypothetical protein